jgi:Ca2+-binding EF-hand superfamily protein
MSILKEADMNDDGKVSFEEFETLMISAIQS